jgi:predicted transcriptional regulator
MIAHLPESNARRTLSYTSAMTIRLPPQLRQRLQKLCRKQHRSASDVVRESLGRYIEAEQLRDAREKLRPFAQAKGFVTDEDVFKAVSRGSSWTPTFSLPT